MLSDASKRATYDQYGEEGLNSVITPMPQDANHFVYWIFAGLWSLVTLIDWYSASSGRNEYFYSDGVHLNRKGAAAYSDLIIEAVTASETQDAAAK